METKLQLAILPQPNDTTCGPTCLHAIYKYYDDNISLQQVIHEVTALERGGTLAVLLACHALHRGYSARIYTYNLHMFDPSWFPSEGPDYLKKKLIEQKNAKPKNKMETAARAYLDFLDLGGELRFEVLTTAVIRSYLKKGIPILSGLSSTFLYCSTREIPDTNAADDIKGEPVGHFVVFCGYDKESRSVFVADPYRPNPMAEGHYYNVSIERTIGAIYLGVLTHDANFLIVQPGKDHKKRLISQESRV